MLTLLLLACNDPSGAVVTFDSGPCSADTGTDTDSDTAPVEPLVSGSFADTEVEDWLPVIGGNWPNGLTADACNDANGPTCYDCLHLPTGTYARWYRVDMGHGYATDQWFEAALGQVTFTDYDESGGTGLGTDGAVYKLEPVLGCAPAYWLYQ